MLCSCFGTLTSFRPDAAFAGVQAANPPDALGFGDNKRKKARKAFSPRRGLDVLAASGGTQWQAVLCSMGI